MQFGNAKQNKINQLKEQFVGKNFIWKVPLSSEKAGDPTRCTGIRESGEMNELCLDLSHGMPVPINKIQFHLQMDGVDMGAPPQISESNQEFTRDVNPTNIDKNMNKSPIDMLGKNDIHFQQQPNISTSKKKVNMFENFNKSVTKFKVEVKIELPDPELVDIMYKNSLDKNEFIENFTSYIIENINIDNVKQSIIETLNPANDLNDDDFEITTEK
jgi:hypothetical protein